MRYYSLFSGGKDSITTAHVLAERGELQSLVFFDTGIGTPDIREHVEGVADRFGWPLEVYRTPVDYDEFVLKYGFPQSGWHNTIMHALKGRGAWLFHREHPEGVLASGVRSRESRRRFVNTRAEGTWQGAKIIAPIHGWSTEKVWAYVRKHDLPLSPAYRTLHMSGDCLCGAYADSGELMMIRLHYPEVFERLARLEARMKGQKYCRWGGASTEGVRMQSTLACFECEATA